MKCNFENGGDYEIQKITITNLADTANQGQFLRDSLTKTESKKLL